MFNSTWINTKLPHALKRVRMTAWMVALLKPLVSLYNTFSAYRSSTRERLLSTGQVIYLERWLQERFIPGIFITTEDRSHLYVGRNTDGTPLMVALAEEDHVVEVGKRADYEAEYDFIVHVPNITGKPTEAQVRAQVEIFRLAGKSYDINYFNPE